MLQMAIYRRYGAAAALTPL